MGSRGDAYDNAIAESFFATLAYTLLARHRVATPVEARLGIFRNVEGWCGVVIGSRSATTMPFVIRL